MSKKKATPKREFTDEEWGMLSAGELLADSDIRFVEQWEWNEKFNCSGSVTGRAAKAFRPRKKE